MSGFAPHPIHPIYPQDLACRYCRNFHAVRVCVNTDPYEEGAAVCPKCVYTFWTTYRSNFHSLGDQTCYTCGVLALYTVGVDYIPEDAPDDAYDDVGNDDDEGMCHFCSHECLKDWMVKDLAARVIQKSWRKLKGGH